MIISVHQDGGLVHARVETNSRFAQVGDEYALEELVGLTRRKGCGVSTKLFYGSDVTFKILFQEIFRRVGEWLAVKCLYKLWVDDANDFVYNKWLDLLSCLKQRGDLPPSISENMCIHEPRFQKRDYSEPTSIS